jgi:DNA polymerase-4
MEVLHSVTPLVEPISIDEAFLDVSGARRQFGSPVEVGGLIRTRIREEVGLPASVGIAATKSVAKIASAHAKPDGRLLIPKDRTLDFLHPLPIGALWGVGKRTGEVLRVRGIDTVGQLANVPIRDLAQWIGNASAQHLNALAWGVDDRAVSTREREKSISTERTFEVNVTSPEVLKAFILRAAHDCARRLRKMGLLAWTVTVKVRDQKFNTTARSKTLLAPTDVGREIAQVATSLIEMRSLPSGGVRLAGVGVSSLVGGDGGVPTLLDEDPRPRVAELAMDAAQERFGAGAVMPASLLPGKK